MERILDGALESEFGVFSSHFSVLLLSAYTIAMRKKSIASPFCSQARRRPTLKIIQIQSPVLLYFSPKSLID